MENIFAKTTQNILRVVKDKFEKEKYKNLKNLNKEGELNQLELCKNCLDYDL